MSELQPEEQVWVTVAEGAQKTGFHPDHVRRLARESWRLPEEQRSIRIRKESNEYAIWLPDLMDHVRRHIPWAGNPEQKPTDEIWVNTTEAAAITGYSRQYLKHVANKSWKMPEAERPIKVLNRIGRYEIWLPDLVKYLSKPGRGPQSRRKSQ